MPFVGIRTVDQSYIGPGPNGGLERRPFLYLFAMAEVEEGFTLRAVGGDHYLTASGDDAGARLTFADSASGHVFSADASNSGRMRLRSATHGYVSFEEDGFGWTAEAEQAGLFEFESLDLPDELEPLLENPAEADSCGVEVQPEWDTKTHAMIVDVGIDKVLKQHANRLYAKLFLDQFWKYQVFKDAVLQGLYDADYEYPYNQGIFLWHFYDPDLGRSFIPVGSFPHARSVGTFYWSKGLVLGHEILSRRLSNRPVPDEMNRQCGYFLGLSLHFLTDLTQPMHATNFTNASLPLGFHSKFETFVEDHRETILGNPPPITGAELDALDRQIREGGYHGSTVLHEVAVQSKPIFTNKFQPWLNAGNRDLSLNDPAIKDIVEQSTAKAPGVVARFAYGFCGAIRSNQALFEEGRWYEIKEHTKGELMTSPKDNGGWIERWSKLSDEPDRQQFCFVPDGVGTYRIVSKSDTKYCWRMSRESDIRPWYYAMWSRVEHSKYTAFSPRLYRRDGTNVFISIIEPTQSEDITISWGLFDSGRALRWARSDDTEWRQRHQTFQLVPKAAMSHAEHQKITRYWAEQIGTQQAQVG